MNYPVKRLINPALIISKALNKTGEYKQNLTKTLLKPKRRI